MIGGILRPVARLVCLCVLFFCLVGSGRADDFVAYNSVFGAMKIDCFFVVLRRVFCCAEKIKFIY